MFVLKKIIAKKQWSFQLIHLSKYEHTVDSKVANHLLQNSIIFCGLIPYWAFSKPTISTESGEFVTVDTLNFCLNYDNRFYLCVLLICYQATFVLK